MFGGPRYSGGLGVQSDLTICCPEEWKKIRGRIDDCRFTEVKNPIDMEPGDAPFRFTLMLKNVCDPDSASACEFRFYLVTDSGRVESRSIWLSQGAEPGTE